MLERTEVFSLPVELTETEGVGLLEAVVVDAAEKCEPGPVSSLGSGAVSGSRRYLVACYHQPH